MVVSKCVFLTKSSVFFYDYGRLCTVVCVVPRNLLGKWFCMCYMWSEQILLTKHFMYMPVGLVVFICM